MRVLFLGEGSLGGSALYLAAILRWSKIPFDHRPDRARLPKRWRQKSYDAVILSDYRYSSFTPCAREWLRGEVEKGTGLLMIGGWASFTGLVGGYAGTDIEKLLPVTCVKDDDRVNGPALLCPPPSWGRRQVGGNAFEDVPLIPTLSPPGGKVPVMVCGYHRAKPKPGTQTAMVFRDLLYKNGNAGLGVPRPALVLGRYGRARTAAFLTDCAPHWAGGLIDWGSKRVTVAVAPGVTAEVGDRYLQFFHRWIAWVSRRQSV